MSGIIHGYDLTMCDVCMSGIIHGYDFTKCDVCQG